MINDNKEDFLKAVVEEGTEFRKRAYEALVETFVKKCVSDATTVKVPDNVTLDDKNKIKEHVTTDIANSAKQLVGQALIDDGNELYNVEIAHDIESPDSISKNIQKLLAEAVFDESKDRAKVLAAQFDAGSCENLDMDQTLEFIKNEFVDVNFDSRFQNYKSLESKLRVILATEGQKLVASIKADVDKLVTETENKNSVIREAVSEINSKKAEIEEKINGKADPFTGGLSENKSDDKETTDKKNESDAQDPNALDKELQNAGASTEGWYGKSKKQIKSLILAKEDLYQVLDYSGPIDTSAETLSRTFDENSFSKEQADMILDQFRQLDDDIDSSTIDDEKALSADDDNGENQEGTSSDAGEGDSNTSSSENEYIDDDGNPIEVNGDLFKYDDITADPLSEESMSRDFLPLSPKKLWERTIKPNTSKFATYLALLPSKGEHFFEYVRNRGMEMMSMLSKEDQVCDTITNDQINKKVTDTLGLCSEIEVKTKDLIEDFGITGILSDKYQRTDKPVENAMGSLFNPAIIGTDKDSKLSKEELHEHELAEILKLGIKIQDVKNDIIKKIDVSGNTDKLGYLEELLNEKMFTIEDPLEKTEVQEKIDALQSIESMIPIQEVVNMKVFLNKDKIQETHVTIDSIKDVEAYGFSYVDLVEEIKENVKKNYKEHFKGKAHVTDVDIEKLTQFMIDEVDTTKIGSTIYESILSKLTENVDSFANATEACVINNKARVLTTAVVTCDKLGFISEEQFRDFKNYLM